MNETGTREVRDDGRFSTWRGLFGLAGLIFAMFALMVGANTLMPVHKASADAHDYGPDGYFSTMLDGATPLASPHNEWPRARRIVFGRTDSSQTYGNAEVSGGYKMLAKGEVASEHAMVNQAYRYTWSYTTSVAADEVLLWSDDVVTAGFTFNEYNVGHSFENPETGFKSNLALASESVAERNYSIFERTLLRKGQLEGVCSAELCSVINWWGPQEGTSTYEYSVFALAIGDVKKYFGVPGVTQTPGTGDRVACPSKTCANGASGSWFRSANWDTGAQVTLLGNAGDTGTSTAYPTTNGLRPAFRLRLDSLLLSANAANQSQVLTAPDVALPQHPDSLRLTFVESGTQMTSWSALVTGGVGSRVLDLQATSNLSSAQDAVGWKLVEKGESEKVRASGVTDAATGGSVALPSDLSDLTTYDLYVWGQDSGSSSEGWSNKASEPVVCTLTGDEVSCPKSPPSYGIELTGTTAGSLTAYRIGDYAETVFDQTGALKSVRLDTPAVVKDRLKTGAESAGGSNVDEDNPVGWVASKWLGYPTDPLSDDVTSAFSPYAGQLQLFAQELAKDTGALGAAAGSLPKLDGGPETLKVSGPGLYLIVDSKQNEGGSLPIVVGTKVFNEALGDDGGFVDFVDAGVKGKPRLGQAALKTTVTDIAKRIVNDAGMDGFDVGSEVEFEIALRVPDLSGFSSVSYDSYVFDVADVAASGLTLPAGGSGVEVFVDALSPTQPQTLPPSSIAVSGDTLSVGGLKVLFAESSGSGVRNKDSVPVGSLMRLRYRAVLNASAVVSSPVEGESLKPNVNAATLTRSYTDGVTAGWADNGDGTESKSATANAYTFKLDVVKLDKDDRSTKLGDVEFEVSRDGQPLRFEKVADGVYRLAVSGEGDATQAVTTHTDGTLSLQGVEARELSFKETTAPSGYFKVSDFTVDIRPEGNADATQVTKVTYATSGTNLAYVSKDGRQIIVLDPAWSLANLPYTGGMGILTLLVVGGLILMFAVRPYVLSKRAERDANLV